MMYLSNMEKSLTPFGIYFRRLRKKHSQTIYDLAKLFGVSAAYLSAIEHGKREIPSRWREIIIEQYSLSSDEIKELDDSIRKTPSNKRITINDVKEMFTNFIENVSSNEEQKKLLSERLEELLRELK